MQSTKKMAKAPGWIQHLEDYNQEDRCNGDEQRHAMGKTGLAGSLGSLIQVAFFTQICLGIRTAKTISTPA